MERLEIQITIEGSLEKVFRKSGQNLGKIFPGKHSWALSSFLGTTMDKIFEKNSCDVPHYEIILIYIFQQFFASINKNFFWEQD